VWRATIANSRRARFGETNISPVHGDEVGRSSQRDKAIEIQFKFVFDWNRANDSMMNF
jgi:hypothetical protein